MKLLFVCTGNICRSPTAERLADAWAARHGDTFLDASSAGTRAVVGYGMEPTAARVLSSLGGDPTGFVARQLTPVLANDADLIVTMTEAHRDAVLRRTPRGLKRTFTLLEAAHLASTIGRGTVADLAAVRGSVPRPRLLDVPDPIGCDADMFTEVGDLIDTAVTALLIGLAPTRTPVCRADTPRSS